MGWLEELQNQQINEPTIVIRNHLDDITRCYHQVEDIYPNLSTQIDSQALNAFCLAWQHQHLANQAKGASKLYHQEELNFWLSYAEPLQGGQAEATIKKVFDSFDEMVRSSSLIEMVNSIIRPYLNSSKGQITPETPTLGFFIIIDLIKRASVKEELLLKY